MIKDLVAYGLFRREKIYNALKNLAVHNLIMTQNLDFERPEIRRENRKIEKRIGERPLRRKNRIVGLTSEGYSLARLLYSVQNKDRA